MQANGHQASMFLDRQEQGTAAARSWLVTEAPADIDIDDDFEGNRNWAVILIVAALTVSPLIGISLLVL